MIDKIYKGLDVGTAKDTKEEIGNIPHYMTDIIEPGTDFSVYDYVSTALPIIRDILERLRGFILQLDGLKVLFRNVLGRYDAG